MVTEHPLPFVSIVIPTYNRGEYLEKLISSLCHQTYDPELYEIIIVNNGSTDNTVDEIARLRYLYKSVSITDLFEPKAGETYARNAGNTAARGEILVSIDDDAFAAQDWLENLVIELLNDDQVICVSGRIDLSWQAPRPDWLPVELETYLGCNHHLGDHRREIGPDLVVFEGNSATYRSLVLEAGGYDYQFGMVGNKIGAHAGTTLTDRLRKYGKIIYTPSALVYHIVPEWRIRPKYFLNRGFRQGMADARLAQARQPRNSFGLLQALAADTIFLAKEIGYLFAELFRCKRGRWFFSLVLILIRLGAMWERSQMVRTE